MKRIALIGDYNEAVVAHRAIPLALRLTAERLQAEIAWDWTPTATIKTADVLQSFDAVWCTPGSPYASMGGALRAIRFARQTLRPFLGTCGGFQHALLEYAQAEWGLDAAHAETDPDAIDPIIAPLTCSLINVAGELHLIEGSKLAAIYGAAVIKEEYHCSYGFNPLYESHLASGPLRVAARDAAGSVRAVELQGHPFFIATLFQPERAALQNRLPPVVEAFVRAIAA